MELTLSNFSVVILAQAHNPSILNPDFLRQNDIVAENFKPRNVVCTQPVAQVVYEEGISIIAEFERLQFVDVDINRIPQDSPIPDIALRYIGVLPHVRYKSVGINFAGHCLFAGKDSARSFISKKFVKPGTWLSEDEVTDVGITFAYHTENGKNTLTIKPGEVVKSEGSGVPAILINANYHLDVSEGDLVSIKSFVSGWQVSYDHFKQFVEGL